MRYSHLILIQIVDIVIVLLLRVDGQDGNSESVTEDELPFDNLDIPPHSDISKYEYLYIMYVIYHILSDYTRPLTIRNQIVINGISSVSAYDKSFKMDFSISKRIFASCSFNNHVRSI